MVGSIAVSVSDAAPLSALSPVVSDAESGRVSAPGAASSRVPQPAMAAIKVILRILACMVSPQRLAGIIAHVGPGGYARGATATATKALSARFP